MVSEVALISSCSAWRACYLVFAETCYAADKVAVADLLPPVNICVFPNVHSLYWFAFRSCLVAPTFCYIFFYLVHGFPTHLFYFISDIIYPTKTFLLLQFEIGIYKNYYIKNIDVYHEGSKCKSINYYSIILKIECYLFVIEFYFENPRPCLS